ncbi:MAG TPA: fimbria/pilus outer membrane usher protein [Nevskiales bacterium]|nr:fimbria/pilus outer membrane usher protein [Nevskiales bacterium]
MDPIAFIVSGLEIAGGLAATLQSVSTPEWFPPACEQPATPGYALVEVHDTPRVEAAPGSAVLWIEPDGTVWAREQDLSSWIREPPIGPARERAGARWHDLRSTRLPYRYDPCLQTLWIAPPRDSQQLSFARSTTGTMLPARPSAFLNADFFSAQTGGARRQYAGLLDLGLAKGFGSFRSAWSADRDQTRRLDSFFTLDDPERVHRLRIGDGITRSHGLGTAVRYGGLRWGTDFSLQPEVPRFALPGLSGEAALPSSVELYVDGQLRDRREVDPGPFAISNPPVLTGSGDLQVVVRDALGRETVYVQPFYVSTQTLADGIADYAIEIGRLRENFGSDDDRYGDGFLLGNYRYGASDRLTAGARLELQSDARLLGGTAVYLWPRIGQFNTALAISDGDAGSGAQFGLGYERIARGLSLGLQGSWSDPEYVELGRSPGAVARSLRAQLGMALPRRASLTLGWAEEIRRDRDSLELTALTYSQTLFGWYGSASWLHSPQAGDSALLGLSRPLANGHTLALQLQRESNGDVFLTLTWQHSPGGPLGWYSFLSGSGGDRESSIASAAYTGQRGSARLTTAEIEGLRTTQAELSSGLVWIDSDLYWTRPIRESFALADASAPGVRIYRDNQLVGITGDSGRVLVPDLITYNTTRISLDTEDLPLDRGLTEATQDIKVPPGGARVTLARPALPILQFRLVLESGEAVPAGAQLSLDGQPLDLPVGVDGLVYLETPAERFALQAQWSKGQCRTQTIDAQTPATEVACQSLP